MSDSNTFAPTDPVLHRILDGRYRIDARLGVGAVGTVYRATAVTTSQRVAVKVLRRGPGVDERAEMRFLREARALALVDHPNVVRCLDYGRTADGTQYLVLELLEGEPLSRLIARVGIFSVAEATDIAHQVLEGLAAAHAQGVVHRDLKPSNLFVAREPDGGERIKVIDFGVAKLLHTEGSDEPLSTTNAILGSPRYMAPEQALNAPVGPQADLYALAVILYELLTGGPLFADESAFDYITAHVHKVPQWPSRGGQALSGPLVELIVRCLAKDPFERPPSARAALAWLEAMNRATARPTVRALAAVDASATPEVDAEIIWADEGDDSPSLSVPYQIGVVDPAATEVSREPLRMGGGYAWWEIALLGLAAGIAFFIGLRFFSDGSPKGDVVASVQPAPRLAVAEVDAPGGGAWVAVETLGSPSLSVPYQIGVAGPLPAGMASRQVQSDPPGAAVWLGSDRLGITPLEVRWPAAFEAPVLNVQLGDWQGDVDLGAPGTGPVVLRFATHRGGPQRSVE